MRMILTAEFAESAEVVRRNYDSRWLFTTRRIPSFKSGTLKLSGPQFPVHLYGGTNNLLT